MICCICGESLDFARNPIGDIVITNYKIAKFMCKKCKELKKNIEKEED